MAGSIIRMAGKVFFWGLVVVMTAVYLIWQGFDFILWKLIHIPKWRGRPARTPEDEAFPRRTRRLQALGCAYSYCREKIYTDWQIRLRSCKGGE